MVQKDTTVVDTRYYTSTTDIYLVFMFQAGKHVASPDADRAEARHATRLATVRTVYATAFRQLPIRNLCLPHPPSSMQPASDEFKHLGKLGKLLTRIRSLNETWWNAARLEVYNSEPHPNINLYSPPPAPTASKDLTAYNTLIAEERLAHENKHRALLTEKNAWAAEIYPSIKRFLSLPPQTQSADGHRSAPTQGTKRPIASDQGGSVRQAKSAPEGTKRAKIAGATSNTHTKLFLLTPLQWSVRCASESSTPVATLTLPSMLAVTSAGTRMRQPAPL